jgi:hypothetical protein
MLEQCVALANVLLLGGFAAIGLSSRPDRRGSGAAIRSGKQTNSTLFTGFSGTDMIIDYVGCVWDERPAGCGPTTLPPGRVGLVRDLVADGRVTWQTRPVANFSHGDKRLQQASLACLVLVKHV